MIEQLSEATGSPQVTDAEQSPAALSTVIGLGAPVIVGSSSSVTVIVKLAVSTFPESSVAV